MHSLERRGAHNSEHVPGRMANWDLVRIFLEVARVGSFRAAAERMNMSANFLSKRISMLEQAYKTTLMTRHVDGIRLTREGLQVLEAAKRMEEASFGLDCALNQATPALSGEVRIAVTEGLGTFWLAPRLVEFQRAFPSILVDLKCEMKSADVLRLEADVAVQLGHPDQHTRAGNFQWYFQTSTSAAASTTEFSFAHGLQATPHLAWPILDLSQPGCVAGGFVVSKAADSKRVYLKPVAGSTNAPCLFLVE